MRRAHIGRALLVALAALWLGSLVWFLALHLSVGWFTLHGMAFVGLLRVLDGRLNA